VITAGNGLKAVEAWSFWREKWQKSAARRGKGGR